MKHGFSWLKAILVLASLALIVAFLYPIFARSRTPPGHYSCFSNLTQISLGFMQYQQDYDDHYPPAAVRQTGHLQNAYGWADVLQPYVKGTRLYHCPTRMAQEGNTMGQTNPRLHDYTDYWFNGRLSRENTYRVNNPAVTLLSGDGNDGSDVTTARYALYALPQTWLNDANSPAHRHLDSIFLLFADGHTKSCEANKLTTDGPVGTTFNGLLKTS